ncbi:butirosin biosynthesis protein BtrG [Niallia circulans]|jgi:gamma-glutamylcyclotransferase (GGCT)/AIG2-like uncharacterized protein YtfP|uniref:gamma-glutamylcyclotransferase family protein n=1 Tax=Shouchella clausii TaxID=79880 RepID=UPI000B979E94|nr:gamma-glutamylcyclotransferase family protein [Shouchella clausii]SPU17795.1 butirosin biosynthesis protein BtrG [Niallia circulans]AST95944.1 hypothetical protein BC8716_08265 [Shouchella clausii]MCM3548109.1 gamma-glutamylcyclotransferase [Shouchella clausii]MCR1287039.1 gamma-glutamylcyclotransferase [Shouchella clausii]MEB5471464.1 gamma-glutamylcyclotransferase [Shouchella clausii]
MQGNNKNLLFVYGTLRKGGANDHYLQHSELVEGMCWITGEMHNTPFGYPIVRFRGQEKIRGELYAVTSEELVRIDKLEGYDPKGKSENEYERVECTVYTDESEATAYTYIAGKGFAPINEPIIGGDWLVFLARKKTGR